MLTVVIARYQENVEWVNQLRCNVVILDKQQLGNTGREAASWLWFIATQYPVLSGDYVFAQGNPFEHCPDFVQTLGTRRQYGARAGCDHAGAPHHPGLRIPEIAADRGALPARIQFTIGAQFQRTATELKARSQAYYYGLLNDAKTHPQAPWIFERLWDYLIP